MDKFKKSLYQMDIGHTTKKSRIPMETTHKSRIPTHTPPKSCIPMDTPQNSRVPIRHFNNVDKKPTLCERLENLFRVHNLMRGPIRRIPKFNQVLPVKVKPLHQMDTTKKVPASTCKSVNVGYKQRLRMGLVELRKVRAYFSSPQQEKMAQSCYAGDSNAHSSHQMDTTQKSRVPTSQIVTFDKKRKLRTGGKPSSQVLGGIVEERRTSKRTCRRPPHPNDRLRIPRHEYNSQKVPPYPYKTGKLPPHPQDSGMVSQVNICPECEAYSVKELERQGTSYPREEALRARYMCASCPKSFDLGITMFDPRGWPGVTLYEGADLFQPPVPPSGRPPCPRCLRNAEVSFQCMTLYLREDSRVPCQPACPAPRFHLEEDSESEDEECQSFSVRPTLSDRQHSDGVRLPIPLTVDTEREWMKRLAWTVIGRHQINVSNS